MKLDFFVRNRDDVQRAAQVWEELNGERGTFIVSSKCRADVPDDITPGNMALLSRDNPLVVFTQRDKVYASRRVPGRKVIMIENGKMEAGGEIKPCLTEKQVIKLLRAYVEAGKPKIEKVEQVDGESIGIVYMAFGSKAAKGVDQSVESLYRTGLEIPVTVVGDTPVNGMSWVRWQGEDPFDPTKARKFQFRAGRVKPYLYDLSPYERTLYIDADTEFLQDIIPAFEMLSECDLAVTEEKLTLNQLYNQKLAGWELNLVERDETIKELGGDGRRRFINSGVIFFRKSKAVKAVFQEWGKQWLRFQEWDEQLSLMRAIHKVKKLNYCALPVEWNNPHRVEEAIIFHNYGRGTVRCK